jgi:hypothetical protein
MDHMAAYEALNELLHVDSVECRYGAFRALWTRNPRDPMIRGENMSGKFSYHVIGTTGEPLVHVSRSRRPEIVLFGADVRLGARGVLLIGKQFSVRPETDQQYRVVKFVAGEDSPTEYCTNQLDQVIRSLVKLGAGYPDIIEFLRIAKQGNVLTARLAFEALAMPGRTFRRGEEEAAASEDTIAPAAPLSPEETVPEAGFEPDADRVPDDSNIEKATTPESAIFRDQLSRQPEKSAKKGPDSVDTYVHPDYQNKPGEAIWSKMQGWWK